MFIGRTDAEAPILEVIIISNESWLIRKDPDSGKDWRQEKKGTTEDEMGGWHHWLNEHEFEQVLRDGEGQGSLVCCSPWSQTWLSDCTTTKKVDSLKRLTRLTNPVISMTVKKMREKAYITSIMNKKVSPQILQSIEYNTITKEILWIPLSIHIKIYIKSSKSTT